MGKKGTITVNHLKCLWKVEQQQGGVLFTTATKEIIFFLRVTVQHCGVPKFLAIYPVCTRSSSVYRITVSMVCVSVGKVWTGQFISESSSCATAWAKSSNFKCPPSFVHKKPRGTLTVHTWLGGVLLSQSTSVPVNKVLGSHLPIVSLVINVFLPKQKFLTVNKIIFISSTFLHHSKDPIVAARSMQICKPSSES